MTLAEQFEAAKRDLGECKLQVEYSSGRYVFNHKVSVDTLLCTEIERLLDRAAELARDQEGVVQQIVGRKR